MTEQNSIFRKLQLELNVDLVKRAARIECKWAGLLEEDQDRYESLRVVACLVSAAVHPRCRSQIQCCNVTRLEA